MSNLNKIRNRIDCIRKALDNVEYGRMPISHLEESFDLNTEYIRSLLDSERFNVNNKEAEISSTSVSKEG